jgi:hypothetical protein
MSRLKILSPKKGVETRAEPQGMTVVVARCVERVRTLVRSEGSFAMNTEISLSSEMHERGSSNQRMLQDYGRTQFSSKTFGLSILERLISHSC